MGKKLYVGNLPFSTTDASLQSIFAANGTVESAKVVVDRETGRSKGFGFVEMSTDEEANRCVEQLNGYTVDGRQIRVSEARPQEEGRGNRGGGGGGGRHHRSGGGGGGGRGGSGGGNRHHGGY